MHKTKQIHHKRIIFSQWSKKSYAVFTTLNKVVNIGHLSVDICIACLLKKPTLITFLNPTNEDNSDEDERRKLQDNPMLLQLLPMVTLNSDIAPKQKRHILP